MEQYKTETGRREDLEALETNPGLGFIGPQIMPIINSMEKTGVIYYRTLTADSAAETGRSTGVAPNRVVIADSNTSFSCAEAIKGYEVDRNEVKQMGGIEAADKLGGAASKRSVQRIMEEAIADAVLLNSGAIVDDIETSLIGAVEAGCEAIRRYPGQTAFVCSSTIFRRIMKYTEIINRFSLSSAVLAGADAKDVIERKPAALRMALSSILGVDVILVGDDDQWYDSDAKKQTRAALVKLPGIEEFSHKMDPVFGKNVVYLPDGKQPFVIESFYDESRKMNVYDASVWYQLKTLNAGALYILTGIDASNSVTTSTTTTAA